MKGILSIKNIVLFAVIAFNSILGHAKESPFFLSSDEIVQEKQASLKQLCSFVFFSLLKMEEKKANQTIELLNQDLKKVAGLAHQKLAESKTLVR